MAFAACNDDGRTLREPGPDQTQSISTLGTSSVPVIDDGADTLPLSDEELTLTAPWFDGESIDPRYTCNGDNIAPSVSWSPAPEGTVEIAVTLRDLDAPDFAHWVIAGISPDEVALTEDSVPLGAYEATNGVGDIGYTGPCPPAGSTHTYVLSVHYLSTRSNLTDGVAADELFDGITAAELASVEVEGTFSRA
jgi:Raf kinase inhibitor-like YbhB/YbcL family protein